MSQTSYGSANDVLMGGGKHTSATFKHIGDSVSGQIVAISDPYQEREYDRNNPGNGALKTYPNSGQPIMTFNFDVQTSECEDADDDGLRRVYMDGARIKKQMRAALLAQGFPQGLAVGMTIDMKLASFDESTSIPGKNFEIHVSKGAAANDLLMNDAPQQQAPVAAPAVQQTYAPAPQAQAPVAAPAPAMAGPTPEQVAAVRAAGIDPATMWPNYVG